ncbi:hypothetical protein CCHR01_11571 [Colletotrichum chrysophilum]|uniref:Uncharacterized protein n=1 Tax=Colletotrichum chrysophilum TaxID=1836956 RepID=A0AAD9AF13_9PEZI|nr:hypothetical protein CCHR01_11571 [Colletotrichum chrysophilum]
MQFGTGLGRSWPSLQSLRACMLEFTCSVICKGLILTDPNLQIGLPKLQRCNVSIQRCSPGVHIIQPEGFRVQKSKGEVDVRVDTCLRVSKADLPYSETHATYPTECPWVPFLFIISLVQLPKYCESMGALTATGPRQVPTLIVPDRPAIGRPRTSIALRLRRDVATAKEGRRAAESIFAAADIQRAFSKFRPLHSPARIALALLIALRRTALPTVFRAETTDSFASLRVAFINAQVSVLPSIIQHHNPRLLSIGTSHRPGIEQRSLTRGGRATNSSIILRTW